jgi:tetraprenyl-beta-curcumene synthase
MSGHSQCEAKHGRRREATASLGALAVANARFWPTVAPHVSRELALWQEPAAAIPDRELRKLAVSKQREEHFNAEVAATLATLSPRADRRAVAQAIVALELLFDYLDGRTERPSSDPVGEGERLFMPLTRALVPATPGGEPEARLDGPDAAYLNALSDRVRERVLTLPAIALVKAEAVAACTRCAQAQIRLHAVGTLGDRQLREWAESEGFESGLGWREYAAGSASSVLAVHALIAAAADPSTSVEDARRIDAAYLAIAAVISMLDSLVDHERDVAAGQPTFLPLFSDREEFASTIRALLREALARAKEAPRPEHHTMTLAGVVAYWTSDPTRDVRASAIVQLLRAELSPTIWPALGVMGLWRAAKRTRALAGKHIGVREREQADYRAVQ